MRKMDEMELTINQKGIKWSWFFMVLALFIWGGYNYFQNQGMSLPMILVILQFLVYFFVTSIAKSKMGNNEGKKQIIIFCVFTCLLLAFSLILGFVVGR